MDLRAIIFDFDGIIADTETPVLRSWQEVYAEHGHELPIDEWLKVIGTWEPLFDPATDLESRTRTPLDWAVIEASRKRREDELAHAEPVLPGVTELVDRARAERIALGVASSSSRRWVEGHLRRLGLLECFGTVVTREDVERTKPAPDLYAAALDRLRVGPGVAVAIEDSVHGITAAKAARMRVVAVPTELTRRLDLSDADLTVDSLAEVTLDTLRALS